jgi:hypothetical protein
MKNNSQRLEQCIFFIVSSIEAEVEIHPPIERSQLRRALEIDFFDFAERFPTDAELRTLFKDPQATSGKLKDLYPMTTQFIESFYV